MQWCKKWYENIKQFTSYIKWFWLEIVYKWINVKLRCQIWFNSDCHFENWINKYREKIDNVIKNSDLQILNGKQTDKWEIYTTLALK